MNRDFAEYLAYSPNGRIEYLKYIIKLADFAIQNKDDPHIAPDTVAKAYQAKENAQRQLEEERRRQHEQRKRDDYCL